MQITSKRPKFCSCHWLPFLAMQQLLSSLTSLNQICISCCFPPKDIIPEFLQLKTHILHTELRLTRTIMNLDSWIAGVAGASISYAVLMNSILRHHLTFNKYTGNGTRLKSLHFILAQSETSIEFRPLSFKLLLSSRE